MGSRVYDNDYTSTSIVDRRVATADGSTLINATEGSTQSVTINTTVNSSDAETLRAIAVSNSATLQALAREQTNQAEELRRAQEKLFSDASGAVTRAQESALSFGRQNVSDVLRYSEDVLGSTVNTVKDLGTLVGEQGTSNRQFAEKLVSDVLTADQSADERNLEKVLTAAKWIVAIVAVILVAPKFAKGARA